MNRSAEAPLWQRACLNLPPRQRYAFTFWGVRDSDSWLRLPSYSKDLTDAPLPFDAGQPNATFWALVDGLNGRRG